MYKKLEKYKMFNHFGLYAFKAHSRTMQGYWSYLNDLMEHFTKTAVEEDWDHFRPWVDKTLGMIRNGDLEDAYGSWCEEVVYLTENYNKEYDLFNDDQLDIYLGVLNQYGDK